MVHLDGIKWNPTKRHFLGNWVIGTIWKKATPSFNRARHPLSIELTKHWKFDVRKRLWRKQWYGIKWKPTKRQPSISCIILSLLLVAFCENFGRTSMEWLDVSVLPDGTVVPLWSEQVFEEIVTTAGVQNAGTPGEKKIPCLHCLLYCLLHPSKKKMVILIFSRSWITGMWPNIGSTEFWR